MMQIAERRILLVNWDLPCIGRSQVEVPNGKYSPTK